MALPTTPSRRTVLRTAAWTAPAVSLAVATPAFAGTTGAVTYQTVTKTFTYDVRSGQVVGPLGIWTIEVTAKIPLSAPTGATINAPEISATVTTSQSASDRLRSQSLTYVESDTNGVKANYAIGGPTPSSAVAGLTVPRTTVPPAPDLLVATGVTGFGVTSTAGAPGTYTVTLGTMSGVLKTSNSAIVVNLVSMTPDPTTQDMTLGTFTVTA